MLVRGPAALVEVLRTWLQHTFDCRTSQLRFKPHELAALAGASLTTWVEAAGARAGHAGRRSSRNLLMRAVVRYRPFFFWLTPPDAHASYKPLELTLAPSAPSDKLKQMVVSVAAHDVRRLWRAYARAAQGLTSQHEVLMARGPASWAQLSAEYWTRRRRRRTTAASRR